MSPVSNVNVGFNAAPAFADLDGDGDTDLLFGNAAGEVEYWENTGSATDPTYARQTNANNPFNGVTTGTHGAPALVDIDSDGDFDVFFGDGAGSFSYYENTGTDQVGVWAAQAGAANPLDGINVGTRSKPRFIDLDMDGDFDLVAGEGAGGTVAFYRNTGTGTAPAFTVVTEPSFPDTETTDPFAGISVGTNAAIAFFNPEADCAMFSHCHGHGVCKHPAICQCCTGWGHADDITERRELVGGRLHGTVRRGWLAGCAVRCVVG